MSKKLSKVFTVVFAVMFILSAQSSFAMSASNHSKNEVRLSLWYDGIGQMKSLEQNLLKQAMSEIGQSRELVNQLEMVEKLPEELIIPLMSL